MNPNNCKSIYLIIRMLLPLLLLLGCTAQAPYIPPESLPDDRVNAPKPAFRNAPNDFADSFDKQFVLQGEQFFDLSRHLRNLAGTPKEAYNTDPFDEVPNSAWFTNRNARNRMTIEEIARGPDTGSGPDTSQPWTIVRAKAEGVTPGFTIVDSRGDKYVIKFDPPGYSGLNIGAEIIGTKLLYAAGYNVPENYITYFHPNILTLGEKVKFTDEKGRKRFMTEADLHEIMQRVEYRTDGLIRATASKYVPGKVLGPFDFEGTRKDDPNDLIPHQHRRELRGLQVVAAWLNHIDTKQANSMDTYITENGKAYVKHYLIDFGTCLGSGGHGPQPKKRGHENEMDPHAILLRMLTFGLYAPGWERLPDEVPYPCIGRYESKYYHPGNFEFIFPNPAYDNRTNLDGYWGAKLVMSFTDAQLEAVVAQAQYPDPDAAKYLLNRLIERRDITGNYWFNRVNSLAKFELVTNSDEIHNLQFIDLSVFTELKKAKNAKYRYSIARNGELTIPITNLGQRTSLQLPNPLKFSSNPLPDNYLKNQWEVTLQAKYHDTDGWSKWIKVFLSETDEGTKFELLGVRRQS